MNNIPDAYTLIKEKSLPDLRSEGTLLVHKKSGARIVLMENNDENKVFYIGFKTPVSDSTGVPHITEHSVLCGSDKYPIKDPFVELAKGSMNTFLNAMTYPDKTVYPVASTNDKDFRNLMDVYMDAVLHPNIYHHPEIFEQEGWHYELNEPDGELTLNGVVYNEMKGAFSSPDDVLSREILTSLFPDTTYFFESGGDPEDIPNLTYEDFLRFHGTYYHPSNSYLFLYGDMDMEEQLAYLDKEYLSKYEKIEVDSAIAHQKPFEKERRHAIDYPISSEEPLEDNTYLSVNYVIADILDPMLYQAFAVLDYALLSAPGAPLKEALIKAGIGKDILGGYDSGTLQPVFSVIAKGANTSDEEEFLSIVKRVLKEQAENGIERDSLLAAINSAQFRLREADYGSYPKGLLYGLAALDSWIYDAQDPFLHLDGIRILDELKEKADTGLFEELIKKYMIDNTHVSVVVVEPKRNLTQEKEQALKEKLAAYKETLSDEQIRALIERTAHLKEYQAAPDTQEQLEKLPLLTREDLKQEVHPFYIEEHDKDGIRLVHHNLFTNGIHYLNLVFSLDWISEKDAAPIGFFSRVLGSVNTESYTYGQFANEINLHTGGLAVMPKVYTDAEGEVRFALEIHSKYLFGESINAHKLLNEMLFTSDFTDKDRIRELLEKEISGLQMLLMSAGHALSAGRAASYFSIGAKLNDEYAGIGYLEYLKKFDESFDESFEEFVDFCRRMTKRIFTKKNLLISTTGEDEALSLATVYAKELAERLPEGTKEENQIWEIAVCKKNEGIFTAAQVQYVSRAGNFRERGFAYNGAMKVLKTILSYDYFWLNVRVKGGAYGCMANLARCGEMKFSSYRDPNLVETNKIFEETGEYLRSFEASDRDMTKYVIGTVSTLDMPLTPSQDGVRSLNAYINHLPIETLEKERREVIGCTVEDIRELADAVDAALSEDAICVIGNEAAIRENKELFMEVKSV